MIWKIIGAVVILAVIGGGGFYYYQNMRSTDAPEETTMTVSEAPTPTPSPEEVDKEAYEIEILNGSGIAGEAGRAQTLLEDAEFQVSSTGNADAYDYEETVIQAGSNVTDAFLNELTKELEKQYTVKANVEELDEEEAVIVIVGTLDEEGDTMAVEEADEVDEAEESSDEADTATATPTKSPTPTSN